MAKQNPSKNSSLDAYLNELLTAQSKNMSRKHRAIAEFLLQNSDKAPFYTAEEIAQKSGASPATVIRFCRTLGFQGFPEFVHTLQQILQSTMTTDLRFKLSSTQRRQEESPDEDVFNNVITSEMASIHELFNTIHKADYYSAVEHLYKAERVVIAGGLTSYAVAHYLGNSLSKLLPNVTMLRDLRIPCINTLRKMGPGSLAILVGFPRYSKLTVDMGKAMKQKGATILAITNSHGSPIAELGDITFAIPTKITSYVDSFAAPMAFCNALCTELAERHPKRAAKALEEFEEIAEAFHFFEPGY